MKKGCGPADERVPNLSKKRSRSLTVCNEECTCSENCCCRNDQDCDNEVEPDKLHVIIPINNYVMYESRYKLFERCITQLQTIPNIEVYIVEVALNERPFVVTSSENPNHLQLRTHSVIWHKENMINLMVQRLPRHWKYVAWVDGDIEFHNKNIGFETIHKLQTHDVVQMFQSVVNFGPKGQVVSTYEGFCYQYVKNGFKPTAASYQKYTFPHPGFAWACTKKAWNDMGGLIDFGILGAADHHMALGLIGEIERSRPNNISEPYKRKLREWGERVERTIMRNIGFVEGTIDHWWHGRFTDRKYIERWQIIVNNEFNPDTDIKRDWQGLYMFDKPKFRLRDQIMHYFLQRNEDTIDFNN